MGGLFNTPDNVFDSKLPRIVVAQAERANPLYRSYLTNFEKFEPIQAKKTLASAIQIGNPVSIQKAIRQRCNSSTASSSRPTRKISPTPRRWATGPACSTARTPVWRLPF